MTTTSLVSAVLRVVLLGGATVTALTIVAVVALRVLSGPGRAHDRSRLVLCTGMGCGAAILISLLGQGFPAWGLHALDGMGIAAPLMRSAPHLVVVWSAGTAIAVVRLLSDGRATARAVADAVPFAEDAPRASYIQHGPGAAGRSRGRFTVVVSDRVRVPLTAGFLRPMVVLPPAHASWSSGRLRAVLLHELAHVVRRDGLSLLALRLVACVLWFHPSVWWLIRRFRLEAELSCDEQVLRAGVPAIAYARWLVASARVSRGQVFGWARGFSSPTDLERRVRTLLSGVAPRPSSGVAPAAAVVVLLLALAVPGSQLGARACLPTFLSSGVVLTLD